jgi:1,4-dihydroxy-2-naphthoyl-CoA hydrolase
MTLWQQTPTISELNKRSKNTLASHMNISFTEVSEQAMYATMPVIQEIKQPIGIMHGGASCVLAETVGSTAANFAVDQQKKYCVGLSIYTNHISSASAGLLTAKAEALHLGKSTHVWKITINDQNNKLISSTQLTMAVLTRK